MSSLSAIPYLEDPTKRLLPPIGLSADPMQAIHQALADMPPGANTLQALADKPSVKAAVLAHPAVQGQQAQQQAQGSSLAARPNLGIGSPSPSAGGLFAVPNVSQQTPDLSPLPVPQLSPRTQADLSEYGRRVSTGSGVSQIQNPFIRALARIGDVAGSIVAPNVTAMIPGTSFHHLMDVKQQEGLVRNDLANDQETAQVENLNLQPMLKQQQAALAQEKQSNLELHQQASLDQQKTHQQQQYVQNLRDHGYAPDENDPTGIAIRPLKYEEMSPLAQASEDLKGAQEEEKDAQKAYKDAQTKNMPMQMQLAQQRIANAQHNGSLAAEKLGLQRQQFELKSQGTVNGVAPPGALIGDDGRPVGTAFQQNVRPTGQERNKADMANSAADQLSTLKHIVATRPDIFGPVSGRTTDFSVWAGSQDPDAQRFRAARTIAGDHLAGTFGGRSEAALSAIDDAIGNFKDNPAAVSAGLDQLSGANTRFQKAGTVHTAGSNAERNMPNGRTSAPDTIMVRLPDGRTGPIHPSQQAQFLHDHPGAQVVTSGR